jgi:hypothetical protein
MADKIITQKVVAASEIDRLTIEVVGGVPTCTATYHVVDAGAIQIGHLRAAAVPLTAGQVTTLQNFVTNVVLPAVNAAEGT